VGLTFTGAWLSFDAPPIMKKTIIITLAAIGIIAGYMLLNPANDAKDSTHKAQDESPAETNDSTIRETADLADPSLSNESDTALLMEKSMRDQASSALEKSMRDQASSALEKSMRDQVASALEESNKVDRYNKITEILRHLSPENWRGAIEAFQMHNIENPQSYWNRSPSKWKVEWKLFLQRAGEVAGEESVSYFNGHNTHNCKVCLQSWATTNPAGAIEWLAAAKLDTVTDPDMKNKLFGAAIQGIAQTEDAYLIVVLLEQLPVNARYKYSSSFGKNLINLLSESIGIDETEKLFFTMIDRAQINNELDSGYMSRTFTDLAAKSMMKQVMDGTKSLEEATVTTMDAMNLLTPPSQTTSTAQPQSSRPTNAALTPARTTTIANSPTATRTHLFMRSWSYTLKLKLSDTQSLTKFSSAPYEQS